MIDRTFRSSVSQCAKLLRTYAMFGRELHMRADVFVRLQAVRWTGLSMLPDARSQTPWSVEHNSVVMMPRVQRVIPARPTNVSLPFSPAKRAVTPSDDNFVRCETA